MLGKHRAFVSMVMNTGKHKNEANLMIMWVAVGFLSAFALLWEATISFIMSVRLSVSLSICSSECSHGTTRLQLDRCSWKLTFKYFSKICWEISNLTKIWQEWRVICMKTNAYLWPHLAHFFLEWQMFQAKVAEKIKTCTLRSVLFFSKFVPFIR